MKINNKNKKFYPYNYSFLTNLEKSVESKKFFNQGEIQSIQNSKSNIFLFYKVISRC
jgi:hypothetical protein